MQALDWNDLRYVLVVSRLRRLAPAARQIGVDETTVARRLAHVERALGARLFERIDGMLLPTDMGQIVARQAEHVESTVDQIGHATSGADAKVAGVVRITAVPMVLNRLLVSALPALLQANPLLQLQLVAEPRNLNLIHREADIALRLGRPDREARVIARRLADLGYAIYGPSRASARSLPWITYDSGLSAKPHVSWLAKAIQDDPEAGTPLIVNDSDVVVHAICAGLGRSLLPCCIGDREPGLARLSGPEPVLSRELWLLVHPELRHLARIAVVIAWVEQVIADSSPP